MHSYNTQNVKQSNDDLFDRQIGASQEHMWCRVLNIRTTIAIENTIHFRKKLKSTFWSVPNDVDFLVDFTVYRNQQNHNKFARLEYIMLISSFFAPWMNLFFTQFPYSIKVLTRSEKNKNCFRHSFESTRNRCDVSLERFRMSWVAQHSSTFHTTAHDCKFVSSSFMRGPCSLALNARMCIETSTRSCLAASERMSEWVSERASQSGRAERARFYVCVRTSLYVCVRVCVAIVYLVYVYAHVTLDTVLSLANI